MGTRSSVRTRAVVPAVCAAALAAGCGGEPVPPIVIAEGDLTVTVRPADGTFDIARAGEVVFERATADVLVDDGGGRRMVSLAGCDLARDGDRAFTCARDGLVLRLAVELPAGRRHLVLALAVENQRAAPVTVLRLAPLVVDAAAGGALWLGATPAHHRILENGRFGVFDHVAQLEAGDVERYSLGAAVPIPLRGNSVSNWSHVVADLDDPARALVAGWLTVDRALPTLGIGFDPALAHADGGRTPFTTYAAESALAWRGKPLAPGQSVASERLLLDPLPADPLAALEEYAVELAAAQGVTPWPERGPGHAVPDGWNSWTGGDSTGGHGQDIDHALIAASLDVYRRELGPFGARWFQVDDGWQRETGDWQWRADTFPAGGAAMADEIADADLAPGLWIAPLSVAADAPLAHEHPEWLAPAEDGLIGALGADRETLDLSNPAARAHVGDTLRRLRADGWRWAKVDFAYRALFARLVADPSLTAVEAYRLGWREIRDALGPDVFLVGVGATGVLAGLVDGMRLTLDNGPTWEEESPDDLLATPRSFKATVRTGSRRWFYQDRLWVNHDDLIYFRAWPGGEVPPLTLEESRTFATWIGLMGGVVKVGDKLVDLAQQPAWIDVVRRLLPVWPAGARPLDVLVRDYPEQFLLHVDAPAGRWDVVGLCNWGRNRDWSVTPPAPMPEARRSYPVRCDGDCLVYDFWAERFLGLQRGTFTVDVEARHTRVLALRTPTGAPQLLGTNRHLTQGATDLGPLRWDPATRTLSGTLLGAAGTAAAPWEYHLAFHAPAGFTLDRAEVDQVAAPVAAQASEVVTLRFALPAAAVGASVGFRLVFR